MDEILIKTNEKKLNESAYLLDLITKFRNTDANIIKTNLRNILKPMYKGHERFKRFEGINGLCKFLDIEISELYTYMYLSYNSNLKFETLIWICSMLEISPFSLFEKVNVKNPIRKRWSLNNQRMFIYVKSNSIESAMQEYKLSKKSAMHYYNVFNRKK